MAVTCAGSALAASGCGSVSSVVDPVAKAASISNAAPGYRMRFSLVISSSALPTSLTATGTGSFDAPAHLAGLAMKMNFGSNPQIAKALGGSSLNLVELVDGTTVYMKLPGALTSKIPGIVKPWIKVDLAELASQAGVPGLSSLMGNPTSSNPGQMLQYLRALSGNVTKVGSARVGPFQTTQYHGTIDLDRVANVVPQAERASARGAINALEKLTQLKSLPVDVWVDGHNLVRRLRLTVSEKLPTGQPVSSLYDITIPEYGPQTPPALPPADQVSDLGSLIGSHA